jgi:hypothetical protein
VTKPPVICLITAGHVASTPRLVKNADALVEAGFDVHVLAGAPYPPADGLDEGILASSKWRYTRLDRRGGPEEISRKLVRALTRRLVLIPGFSRPGIAERAQLASSPRLSAAAARIPADLFLGHGIVALPAAAFASRVREGLYGFDIEDYHDAETVESIADRSEQRARNVLQSSFLPGAHPLTCSAPLIAKEYSRRYGVDPLVIMNVFPLSQAPVAPAPPMPISEQRPARLYWFSQTIGPGRGLEGVVAAMGRMRVPAELLLRGFVSQGYRALLQAEAIKAGLRRPIQFLPPGPPGEMARLASVADLGLSVEESSPLNRDICLTNKIFVYLLAGIPQLLSGTSAQTRLSAELGEASIVCDAAGAAAVAAQIDGLLSDPARIARARSRAWSLAHGPFCWDNEKVPFVNAVRTALRVPS